LVPRLDRNLRVIDAREVAGASGLVLLGLEREGVGVDTRHGGAGVVLVGLDLVEVLGLLLLEAVLAVEDKLDGVKGTNGLLIESSRSSTRASKKLGGTLSAEFVVGLGGGKIQVRNRGGSNRINVSGEVPHGTVGRVRLRSTPHKLLHWVVVREANLLGLVLCESVRASVLNLLDEVLVTLLREATALLSVEVDVVGPDLEGGVVCVDPELRREVKIETHLVVLERNERKRETWVAVEEKN